MTEDARRYAVPVAAWHKRIDGSPLAIISDGRRLSIEEWHQTRVSPQEYARLFAMMIRQDPSDWDPVSQTYREPQQEEPTWES